MKCLVTGAGGFIGHHLTKALKARGYWVRGVDIKRPEFEPTCADEFWIADLRHDEHAFDATMEMEWVFALAADMGGMGFIGNHHAEILHNNSLINLNTIEGARLNKVKRYLYTSSACVYPEYRQMETDIQPLKETDAYPAAPDTAYGWEKLFSEQLALNYGRDYGMDVRIPRFHNIFGELGTWQGGREKAPAALCRKVAEAKRDGQDFIEVWGDGEQTRSFCYIDDCVAGILRLMDSDYTQPVNIGSDRMVSINQLARMVMAAAGVDYDIRHVAGVVGVRGRNSDNTLARNVLQWEPVISLEDGLKRTYDWIESQCS